MGSDPKRLDGLSDDEAYAAVALEHVTGGVVRAHDVGRLQGAYDLDLLLPRGRRAAVEVTTHTGPGVRHRSSLLGPRARGRGQRPELTIDGEVPAGLAEAVTALLLVPHVARRAVKVAAVAAADERHLFVGLGDGGLPDPLYRALARPVGVPGAPDPEVEHDGLTHLWLATAWAGSPLLGWRLGAGWSVHAIAG
ncbi:hypothetical protein [Oryzobacter sp. 24SJ04S-52]|uniref:hypothetical protein n=1 Tax=Oryzobacter telluris TaxID=3149179 RepID=UPI00370DAB8C